MKDFIDLNLKKEIPSLEKFRDKWVDDEERIRYPTCGTCGRSIRGKVVYRNCLPVCDTCV